MACVVAAGACGNPSDAGLSGSAHNLAELEERLNTIRGTIGVPGLAVGISEGDNIVWAKGLGYANLETQTPPTPTTDFHLASLTKGFAGVILVKLVSQGVISLDDPVKKFGVNIAGDAGITVRHLANMTSEGTPGTHFSYNGDRFALLQQVIEAASGKSFALLLKEQILQPLSLSRTAPNVASSSFATVGLDRDAFLANLAVGYTESGSSFNRTAYPSLFGTAAGLISTVEDTQVFHFAQLQSAAERGRKNNAVPAGEEHQRLNSALCDWLVFPEHSRSRDPVGLWVLDCQLLSDHSCSVEAAHVRRPREL